MENVHRISPSFRLLSSHVHKRNSSLCANINVHKRNDVVPVSGILINLTISSVSVCPLHASARMPVVHVSHHHRVDPETWRAGMATIELYGQGFRDLRAVVVRCQQRGCKKHTRGNFRIRPPVSSPISIHFLCYFTSASVFFSLFPSQSLSLCALPLVQNKKRTRRKAVELELQIKLWGNSFIHSSTTTTCTPRLWHLFLLLSLQ